MYRCTSLFCTKRLVACLGWPSSLSCRITRPPRLQAGSPVLASVHKRGAKYSPARLMTVLGTGRRNHFIYIRRCRCCCCRRMVECYVKYCVLLAVLTSQTLRHHLTQPQAIIYPTFEHCGIGLQSSNASHEHRLPKGGKWSKNPRGIMLHYSGCSPFPEMTTFRDDGDNSL